MPAHSHVAFATKMVIDVGPVPRKKDDYGSMSHGGTLFDSFFIDFFYSNFIKQTVYESNNNLKLKGCSLMTSYFWGNEYQQITHLDLEKLIMNVVIVPSPFGLG